MSEKKEKSSKLTAVQKKLIIGIVVPCWDYCSSAAAFTAA